MKNIIVTALCMCGLVAFAQKIDGSNFNLPPGKAMPLLNEKSQRILDLSFKLTGKPVAENYHKADLQVLKQIPEEELERYKNDMPEYYEYYHKGEKDIASLSPVVRNIYTEEELWYIYAYDVALYKKLKTIKQ